MGSADSVTKSLLIWVIISVDWILIGITAFKIINVIKNYLWRVLKAYISLTLSGLRE